MARFSSCLFSFGSSALLVAIASGCGKVDKYDFVRLETRERPSEWAQDSKLFDPSRKPKVDLLFVVDNSGSMEGEQRILAASFSEFISKFKDKDVDFHIGVVTTDVSNPGSSSYWTSKLPGYISPDVGCLLSKFPGERFLTSNSVNLVTKFQDNIRVGTIGNGYEQGLNSITQTLKPEKFAPRGCNEGFLRDDALLWVGIVSDENEHITDDGITPESRIDSAIAALNQAKGKSSQGWTLDFIINLSAQKPSVPQKYPSKDFNFPYPELYLMAAQATQSDKIDIAMDFSQPLIAIGGKIANSVEPIILSKSPVIASSVRVTLDGVSVQPDSSNGFVFLSAGNKVELRGSAALAAAGKTAVVKYQYSLPAPVESPTAALTAASN